MMKKSKKMIDYLRNLITDLLNLVIPAHTIDLEADHNELIESVTRLA